MDALDRRDTENRIVIQSHMFENVGLLMMIALAVVAVLCIIQIILLAAGSPAGTWANDAYFYGTSVVTFLLLIVPFYQLKTMSRRFYEQRTPFKPENVRSLRIIGISIIALSLFWGLVVPAMDYLFGFALGNVTNSLWVWAGVMVLFIAHVFNYGCALQQQDDELL